MLDGEKTLVHEGMAFGGPTTSSQQLNDLLKVPKRHP
jgi:hypothetical protein